MDEAEKQVYVREAEEHLQRASHLEADVLSGMLKCHGSTTWRRVANFTNGGPNITPIVSAVTLCKHFTSYDDFEYKKNRFVPLLGQHHLIKRLQWTKTFWIFWEGAKKMQKEVRFVLFHMDEKWYYGSVPRNNIKCLPRFGIIPKPNCTHHKSHVPKVLGLCTMGFLPFGNDIEKGGIGFKTDLQRAGGFEKAQRNSFGRQQNPDGTYHYPKEEWNQLRREGEEYFVPWEVTGFATEVKGKKKFSLKKYFEERLLGKIEETLREASSYGNYKCVARFQWDGAGPHRDARLETYLEEEFGLRGWMVVPQPSQSPVSNIMDCDIFPAMSKDIENRKAMIFTKSMLELDDIWDMTTSSYDDLPREKIARSFAKHHQVVNAIYGSNGRDDFARDKKAMHFGARKHFLPYYHKFPNGDRKVVGVVSVDNMDCVSSEEKQKRQLRYPTPDVSFLRPEEFLSPQEADVLAKHWDFNGSELGQFGKLVESNLIG